MDLINPPVRVFNKHAKDIPEGAVYVGRPTKYGNPFQIGRDGNRDAVCNKFDEYLTTRPDLIADAKRELRGKHLVCWCAPHRCHASTLIRISNEEAP